VIVERYIYRETARAFVAVTVVILSISTAERFVRYLGQAADGRISSAFIWQLLGLKIVESIGLLLPLTAYLSVIVALGRLNKDLEVTAMQATGISPVRVARAALGASLSAAIVVAVLSLVIEPHVIEIKEETRLHAKETALQTAISAGQFMEYGKRGATFYVQELEADGQTLKNVFIHYDGRQRSRVLASARGYLSVDRASREHVVSLTDGWRYEGSPGNADYEITRFQSYSMHLNRGTGDETSIKATAMPTIELLRAPDPVRMAEFNWRLSLPLSTLILGVLAVALSRGDHRQGQYAKLLPAILIYFVYTNLLAVARSLVERGSLSPAIGPWPVHAVVAMAGVALFLGHHSVKRRRN